MIILPVIRLFVFCLILFLAYEASAQTSSKYDSTIITAGKKSFSESPEELHVKPLDAIAGFPGLMYNQFSSLFRLESGDIPYIAGGIVITAGLFSADKYFDDRVRNLKVNHNWVNAISPEITEFGGNYGFLFAGLFAGASAVTGSGKGVETSMFLFEATLSSGLWCRAGKLLAGRERPSAVYNSRGNGSGKWFGPVQEIRNPNKKSVSSFDAFPSGHTATAFSIATVFAEQYNSTPVVPIISYTLASVVGITRMIEHTHWASDIFVGAAIGYLCGKSTVAFNHKRINTGKQYARGKEKKREVQVTFYPQVTDYSKGAGMLLTF
ncbi:MAG: phosphatase PAP2 family protein [Bacteroidetes bacterium]|nr:phosphatase PAP2 family protein [Bacteroidota bacterium]